MPDESTERRTRPCASRTQEPQTRPTSAPLRRMRRDRSSRRRTRSSSVHWRLRSPDGRAGPAQRRGSAGASDVRGVLIACARCDRDGRRRLATDQRRQQADPSSSVFHGLSPANAVVSLISAIVSETSALASLRNAIPTSEGIRPVLADVVPTLCHASSSVNPSVLNGITARMALGNAAQSGDRHRCWYENVPFWKNDAVLSLAIAVLRLTIAVLSLTTALSSETSASSGERTAAAGVGDPSLANEAWRATGRRSPVGDGPPVHSSVNSSVSIASRFAKN